MRLRIFHPCGSTLNSWYIVTDSAPTGARTEFALGPTVIQLMSSHDSTNITAMLTLKSDPTAVTDFTHVLRAPYVHTGSGDLCFGVDISSLNIPGACDGAEATIQISNTMASDMGDMIMYQVRSEPKLAMQQLMNNLAIQCADVILKHTANTASPLCVSID